MNLFCDLKFKSQKWVHQKGLDFKRQAAVTVSGCIGFIILVTAGSNTVQPLLWFHPPPLSKPGCTLMRMMVKQWLLLCSGQKLL